MLRSLSVAIAGLAFAAAGMAAPAGGMGFDVDVTLSPRAATELATRHEGIVLYVDYFGDPKPSARAHADQIGQIDLAPQDEVVPMPGSGGRGHVTGAAIVAQRLAWLAGPPQVNVNVASARKSDPDNLLDCDFIQGAVGVVQRHAPVTLHCYLIAETHPDTRVLP